MKTTKYWGGEKVASADMKNYCEEPETYSGKK